MKRRRQRYTVNGRRLMVVVVVVALVVALVFRHRVERALGLRSSHSVGALAPATGTRTGAGTRARRPHGKGTSAPGGSGVSVSGTSTKGQGAASGSGGASGPPSSPAKSSGSTAKDPGTGSQGSASNGGGSSGSGSKTTPSAPPVTSYPGAPTITAFYSDLSAGKTADAYALLAPGLASQVTPNAFAQTYATVKSAQVQMLTLQSAGNFTRTFGVAVAFTLTSGTIETKNGTVTVQDQSGGVGTPDWQISALDIAP